MKMNDDDFDDNRDRHILEGIERGNVAELLRSYDARCPCEECPGRRLIVALDVAFQVAVEQGLVDWLRVASHAPICPNPRVDVVRWFKFHGHELPTVREDVVAAMCSHRVQIEKAPGQWSDGLTLLMEKLTPATRAMLARSGALFG